MCLLAASRADFARISRQASKFEPGITDPESVDAPSVTP